MKILESQCEAIANKKDLKEARTAFCDICKNLSCDFLPPIDREYIAVISYSLLNIASKSKDIYYPDEIKKQIVSLKPLLNSLFAKNKTCGDEIRRLTEINFNFKSNDIKLNLLNDSFADFYKCVLSAYFGNL